MTIGGTEHPAVSVLRRGPTFSQSEASHHEKRQVSVFLVNSDADSECGFWVGLCRRGPLNPASLLELGKITDLLHEAAVQGIADDKPIMIVNASRSPAAYVYLCPAPGNGDKAWKDWIDGLCKTVSALAPTSIGLYFAPELLHFQVTHELLAAVLARLIQGTRHDRFELLLGSHGVNSVLGTALGVKDKLRSEGIDVVIHH